MARSKRTNFGLRKKENAYLSCTNFQAFYSTEEQDSAERFLHTTYVLILSNNQCIHRHLQYQTSENGYDCSHSPLFSCWWSKRIYLSWSSESLICMSSDALHGSADDYFDLDFWSAYCTSNSLVSIRQYRSAT